MKQGIRRFICAVCAAALLACGASAAVYRLPFSDTRASETNNELITLYDLGLIGGYADNTFRPNDPITRGEATKLLTLICTDEVPQRTATAFADVPQSYWASGYVRYCTERGIVNGRTADSFCPQENVTAVELAKMLLTVVKPGASYVGEDWINDVEVDAEAYQIFKGFYANHRQPITRAGACTLTYNALQCLSVREVTPAGLRYDTDDLENPITILEHRFGVRRFTEIVEANEYADLTEQGGALDSGLTKLAQHRAFPVYTNLSYLGRMADVYVQGDKVIGLPCFHSGEVYYTFSNFRDYENTMRYVSYHTDPRTAYYLNYDRVTEEEIGALRDSTDTIELTIVDHENDGVIDEVLAVAWRTATVTAEEDGTLTLTGADGGKETVERYVATVGFRQGGTIRYAEIADSVYIG